VRLGLNQHLI